MSRLLQIHVVRTMFLAGICLASAPVAYAQASHSARTLTSHHYRLTNAFLGPRWSLAVDVREDTAAGGKRLTMVRSDSSDRSQIWKLVAVGQRRYKLQTVRLGSRYSLDVINDARDDTPHLARTGDFSGQSWTLRPWGDGTYRLINDFTGSDKGLDTYSGSRDLFLGIGNTSGQHWRLTRVRTPRERERVPRETDVSGRDARRFAPILVMHSGEKAFPMDPRTFIRKSRFRGHRGVHRTAEGYSKRQRRWVVSKSKDPEFFDIPVGVINRYGLDADGEHRCQCDGGVTEGKDVYLDARGDLGGTRSPEGRIPVFYYVLPGSSKACAEHGADYGIQYWYFFGENRGVWNYHQGDWEHITVLVKDDQSIGAYYHHHGDRPFRRPSEIRKNRSGRYYVFISKGSHGSYKQPGYQAEYFDKVDDKGVRWDTAQRLLPLTDQPWKDFAGCWGNLYGRPGFQPCRGKGISGPRGPLPRILAGSY